MKFSKNHLQLVLRRSLCSIALVFLFSACVTTQPQTIKRAFWPPLPDEPKIEYISSQVYIQDLESKKGAVSKILGQEEVPIFVKPWGVASSGKGIVYVTDAAQGKIVKFDFNMKTISKFADIMGAYGISIDSQGHLYVGCLDCKGVIVLGANGDALYSFGEGILKKPGGLAVDEPRGIVYVVDVKAHDIKVFSLDGVFLKSIGSRGSGEGEFNFPTDVAVGSKGQLVVSDTLNARIQIFDEKGEFYKAYGTRGKGIAHFQFPKGVTVDSEDHIYVTEALGSHFKIISMEGELLLVVGGPYNGIAPGGFNLPMGLHADKTGAIYIVDQQNTALHKYQYLDSQYLARNPIPKP